MLTIYRIGIFASLLLIITGLFINTIFCLDVEIYSYTLPWIHIFFSIVIFEALAILASAYLLKSLQLWFSFACVLLWCLPDIWYLWLVFNDLATKEFLLNIEEMDLAYDITNAASVIFSIALVIESRNKNSMLQILGSVLLLSTIIAIILDKMQNSIAFLIFGFIVPFVEIFWVKVYLHEIQKLKRSKPAREGVVDDLDHF